MANNCVYSHGQSATYVGGLYYERKNWVCKKERVSGKQRKAKESVEYGREHEVLLDRK